ncbi:TetR/AcrR family transcriptional regulator [Simiduia litorea]|uniref:TetR/AcrR family transcriptional regulator n=1 Tax=Simiduia litorea TaxID=1435348 RepID=UPI0036F41497
MNDTTKNKTRGRSEEKRQQIIDAASHLFTEQGFLSTSMDQVAETAGVSKQTVYSHFGTKDDLFKFCIENRCIASALNEAIFVDNQPVKTVLLAFAHHFQELILSREAIQLCRLCATNAELHPEISDMFFSAGPAQVESCLQNYLARQHQLGTIHCENIGIATDQLLCLLKGSAHFMALLGLPNQDHLDTLDQYLEKSVEMFLHFY